MWLRAPNESGCGPEEGHRSFTVVFCETQVSLFSFLKTCLHFEHGMRLLLSVCVEPFPETELVVHPFQVHHPPA
jgi:hypothetical protein